MPFELSMTEFVALDDHSSEGCAERAARLALGWFDGLHPRASTHGAIDSTSRRAFERNCRADTADSNSRGYRAAATGASLRATGTAATDALPAVALPHEQPTTSSGPKGDGGARASSPRAHARRRPRGASTPFRHAPNDRPHPLRGLLPASRPSVHRLHRALDRHAFRGAPSLRSPEVRKDPAGGSSPRPPADRPSAPIGIDHGQRAVTL